MTTNIDKSPLINLPFAGDTSTWALICHAKAVTLEAHGPYQRRTMRTRTTILTSAGPLDISLPTRADERHIYTGTRLNYDSPWEQRLVYALRTAYNSTPYYELYEPDIVEILNKHHEFLWDFNLDILNFIAGAAGIDAEITLTSAFAPPRPDQNDLRIAIEPKFAHLTHDLCRLVPYTQIFSRPYTQRPFTPNLSMLDLLFNMGPESRLVLNSMIP